MKIDGSSLSPIGSVQAANRLGQVEKKKSFSNTESDKAAVSDKAQVYQTLLQKAKELPSVREDRVQALTKQIERGKYKIDGQRIADRLLTVYQKD